jgi:PAS domain S-box-containing protein
MAAADHHRIDIATEDALLEQADEAAPALHAQLAALRTDNARLRQQLALRDQALDGMQSFFVITRLVGPQRHIIEYCNKSVADQHGLRKEELVGQDAAVLTQWNVRNASYRPSLSDALHAGEVFHYEDEVVRKDGTSFLVGVSTTPIFDHAGTLTHAVAIGADITGKREEANESCSSCNSRKSSNPWVGSLPESLMRSIRQFNMWATASSSCVAPLTI